MRYWLWNGTGLRESPGTSETDLVRELLRVRARLHRLDIETAVLLTEIVEGGEGTDELDSALVDPRCRRGTPS
jgi:hypothetical protein